MLIKKLLEEFSEDVLRLFVQKNADYYIAKWKKMAAKDSKVSWNWAAFLAGALWMGYRKMYLYAFIYMLLMLTTYIPILGFILALVYWIGLGVLANYLYGKFTYDKLVQLKAESSSEEEFKNKVAAAGGVSVAGVFLVILMGIGITAVFMAILMSLMSQYQNTGF